MGRVRGADRRCAVPHVGAVLAVRDHVGTSWASRRAVPRVPRCSPWACIGNAAPGDPIPVPTPAFPVIYALVLMMLLGLSRMAYRLLREGAGEHGQDASPVLLVGAGEGADLFLRALAGDRAAPYRVTGLLSLGQAQTGRRMHGAPILGAIGDAGSVLARLRREEALPGTLVVTEPDLSGSRLAALIADAEREGVRVARAPRPTVLGDAARTGRVELRPVAIEDLLNRPQVPLDRQGMARLVGGRRVLVTGAGGTIGAELARQVAALAPGTLMLLDNGEYALWQIDLELGESHPAVPRRPVIADVRDEARMRAVMEEFRPDLVFHAAALKHVPMVEANPGEGLLTNAAGTRIVADAARGGGATAMVLISTDKAVNPSSVMGASKRLAELYCQGLDRAALDAGRGMRGITVRFGNVLGSTGSVVPDVPAPARARRPDHGDPPRHGTLLHDRARGGRAGAAGDRGRPRSGSARERDLRARHGRAGQDRRSRPADGAPRRVAAGRGHRHRLHRPATRREADRGTVPHERTPGALGHARPTGGTAAHRRSGARRACHRRDRVGLPRRTGRGGIVHAGGDWCPSSPGTT